MNETKEQAIELSDLETPAAGEVKGGPRLIIKKAPTFHDEPGVDLPDLAPQAEVKGGASHTAGRCSCGQEHPYGGGGFINNHNETIASDEDMDTALFADLEPQGEIKGGNGTALPSVPVVDLQQNPTLEILASGGLSPGTYKVREVIL